MRQPVVVDIETKNSFTDVGSYEPTLLTISLVGLYDYASDTYKSFLETEFDKLWPFLERSSFIIGYNSIYFDIPILNKYYAGDLSSFPQLDILKEIKEVWGKSIRLEDVARGSLGVGKTGDGLKALELWKSHKLDALRDYCLADVKLTKEIYEFAKQYKLLKILTAKGIQEVKITIQDPPQLDQKHNFTLPL